jgi:hypothetical protein
MTIIGGYGILIFYSLPYLETGTDWNLTCMALTLLTIARNSKKMLPRELNVLTDGGDGNWSVATTCFYALLVYYDIFEVITVHRLPPGHTHGMADALISFFSRWRWGSSVTKGDRHTGHGNSQKTPQEFVAHMDPMFNTKVDPNRMRSPACLVPANYLFKKWAKKVAHSKIGGLGHLGLGHKFKATEVFAIRIARYNEGEETPSFPTMKYLTLDDFEKNGNKFDEGWKGIDGHSIKVFKDTADLSLDDLSMGGLYIKNKKKNPKPFSTRTFRRTILAHLRSCARTESTDFGNFETYIDTHFPESEADLEAKGKELMAPLRSVLKELQGKSTVHRDKKAKAAAAVGGDVKQPQDKKVVRSATCDQITGESTAGTQKSEGERVAARSNHVEDTRRACGIYDTAVTGTYALADLHGKKGQFKEASVVFLVKRAQQQVEVSSAGTTVAEQQQVEASSAGATVAEQQQVEASSAAAMAAEQQAEAQRLARSAGATVAEQQQVEASSAGFMAAEQQAEAQRLARSASKVQQQAEAQRLGSSASKVTTTVAEQQQVEASIAGATVAEQQQVEVSIAGATVAEQQQVEASSAGATVAEQQQVEAKAAHKWPRKIICGATVQARFGGKTKDPWVEGRVTNVRTNGTMDITYVGGGSENKVPTNLVREYGGDSADTLYSVSLMKVGDGEPRTLLEAMQHHKWELDGEKFTVKRSQLLECTTFAMQASKKTVKPWETLSFKLSNEFDEHSRQRCVASLVRRKGVAYQRLQKPPVAVVMAPTATAKQSTKKRTSATAKQSTKKRTSATAKQSTKKRPSALAATAPTAKRVTKATAKQVTTVAVKRVTNKKDLLFLQLDDNEDGADAGAEDGADHDGAEEGADDDASGTRAVASDASGTQAVASDADGDAVATNDVHARGNELAVNDSASDDNVSGDNSSGAQRKKRRGEGRRADEGDKGNAAKKQKTTQAAPITPLRRRSSRIAGDMSRPKKITPDRQLGHKVEFAKGSTYLDQGTRYVVYKKKKKRSGECDIYAYNADHFDESLTGREEIEENCHRFSLEDVREWDATARGKKAKGTSKNKAEHEVKENSNSGGDATCREKDTENSSESDSTDTENSSERDSTDSESSSESDSSDSESDK